MLLILIVYASENESLGDSKTICVTIFVLGYNSYDYVRDQHLQLYSLRIIQFAYYTVCVASVLLFSKTLHFSTLPQ